MTLTQAGPQCDVCGNFIIFDKSINPFTLNVIPGKTLTCHDNCKPHVLALMGKTTDDPDGYKDLPDGPLRQAFQKWHDDYNKEQS